MNSKTTTYFLVVLLILICNQSHCDCLEEKSFAWMTADNDYDRLTRDFSSGVIKINPIQSIFSEIPVSFELYLPCKRSLQFQMGLIFPIKKKSIFDGGTNMDNEHLFSYRNSPYNSHGLSFKIEYRKYGNKIYYGPQLMYKYSFYNSKVFPVYGIDVTVNQTESKFSNVLGLGYIIGKETESGTFVFDWYSCIGYRVRTMAVTILKIENPDYLGGTTYPNLKEIINSAYPYLNLGVRIGIRLRKTVLN